MLGRNWYWTFNIEDQKQTKNKYSVYILLYIDQLFLSPYVKSSKNLHICFSVMFIIQNMDWGSGVENDLNKQRVQTEIYSYLVLYSRIHNVVYWILFASFINILYPIAQISSLFRHLEVCKYIASDSQQNINYSVHFNNELYGMYFPSVHISANGVITLQFQNMQTLSLIQFSKMPVASPTYYKLCLVRQIN